MENRNDIITRNSYLEKLIPYMQKDLIKVIMWQRRVWKSYILLQIIDYLKTKKAVKDEEIIYINLEDIKRNTIRDHIDLYNSIKDFKYIFIDEIQELKERERALRDLQNKWTYDIYITWSNSTLLSWELTTFLWWRYKSLHVYPLNYQEFLVFHWLEHSWESLMKYIKYGWLPYLKNLALEDKIIYEYLKDISKSILINDVIQRKSIRNTKFYDSLITFIASETWSIFSAKSISDYLINQRIDISSNTVAEYLKYATEACFLNEVSRYDINGKKYFELFQKYYFTDVWIKNALLWWIPRTKIQWVLENVVYCDMVSKGWEVSIWEINKKEVDFICKKDWEVRYLQVAYKLELEETKNRELASLLEIPDAREKYILTMEDWEAWLIDGVKIMNIWEYMLSE